MNKFDKNSIHKGQPNGCPLLFIPIILTIFIATLPACSKKGAYKETTQTIYPNVPTNISYEVNAPQSEIKKIHYKTFVNQARNIDISTPVGFKLVKSDSNEIVENRIIKDAIHFFLYHGNQDIKKVISFYNRELEILGWEFKDLSTKQEGLFICNKSSKTCVVSVRPNDISTSAICITITNKLDQI